MGPYEIGTLRHSKARHSKDIRAQAPVPVYSGS